MPTNDHTVPQMYLKRFAAVRKGKRTTIMAAPPDNLSASFPTSVRNIAAMKDFHWDVDPDGVPHHTMEILMTRIESAAAPAFSSILDTDYALPDRWPPTEDTRVRLSWWIAAQILRTKRQRRRIDHIDSEAGLAAPLGVNKFAKNNPHLTFIATHLAPLAGIIHSKPWGIGFSDACLPTGDVPVIVMNGQDDPDQLLAAACWDVLLPLDPHRFLIMPTPGSQDDLQTWTNHRLKLEGGMGIFITDLIVSAADSHVFYHPDHLPHALDHKVMRGGRLPTPWTGDVSEPPQIILQYGALDAGMTVERRYLTEHAPPTSTSTPDR